MSADASEERPLFVVPLEAPHHYYNLSEATFAYDEDEDDDFFSREHALHESGLPRQAPKPLLSEEEMLASSPLPASSRTPYQPQRASTDRSPLPPPPSAEPPPPTPLDQQHHHPSAAATPLVAAHGPGSVAAGAPGWKQLAEAVNQKKKKRTMTCAGMRTPDFRAESAAPRARLASESDTLAGASDLLAELQLHNQRVAQAGVEAAKSRLASSKAPHGGGAGGGGGEEEARAPAARGQGTRRALRARPHELRQGSAVEASARRRLLCPCRGCQHHHERRLGRPPRAAPSGQPQWPRPLLPPPPAGATGARVP